MLEITPDHIAELADDDLRTLIGLLCEAELSRHNLPISAVTWGGNQRAADGGLDVRVALPAGSAITDFVPRANTGFQVKCQDMPRTTILAEMRPSGVVRPVIRDLADASGAYVIASSQGSTADSALRNRREAMASATGAITKRPPRMGGRMPSGAFYLNAVRWHPIKLVDAVAIGSVGPVGRSTQGIARGCVEPAAQQWWTGGLERPLAPAGSRVEPHSGWGAR
jgi:hypothetical protein